MEFKCCPHFTCPYFSKHSFAARSDLDDGSKHTVGDGIGLSPRLALRSVRQGCKYLVSLFPHINIEAFRLLPASFGNGAGEKVVAVS